MENAVFKIKASTFYNALLGNISLSELSSFRNSDEQYDLLTRLYFTFALLIRSQSWSLKKLRDDIEKKHGDKIDAMCIAVKKDDLKTWVKYQSAPFIFLRIVYTHSKECSESFLNKICISISKTKLWLPLRILPCTICGKDGTGLCSRCGSTQYCSVEHQQFDWDRGHKDTCHGNRNKILEKINRNIIADQQKK